MADYDRKVQSFNEAKSTVDAARKQEKQAHDTLASAMNYEVDFLQYMINGALWTLVGINQSLLTTPQSSVDTFTKKAQGFWTKADNAASAAEYEKYATSAAWAESQAAKSAQIAGRLSNRLGIGAQEVGMLGKSVKGVPVLGTAIATGVQADAVINHGKPVGKAGMNLLGGTLGGIGGAMLVGGLVGGPVGVLVVVGVGAIGAGVGSYLGEATYDGLTEGGK